MSVQVVPSSAFITMPWANGQGQTCQLFKLVHPLKPDQFALRLSVATVSQGSPFSSFVGIDRQLSLLEGDGMVLTMEDGSKHILDVPGKVVEFGGEVKVDCELIGGVLRDFNVMVARDWGTAIGPFEYRIVKEGVGLEGGSEDWSFVYLHTGTWELNTGRLEAPCLVISQKYKTQIRAVSGGIAILSSISTNPTHRSVLITHTRETHLRPSQMSPKPRDPLKRAQQNREAQRTSRERKKAYIANLEQKVAELEALAQNRQPQSVIDPQAEAIAQRINHLQEQNDAISKSTAAAEESLAHMRLQLLSTLQENCRLSTHSVNPSSGMLECKSCMLIFQELQEEQQRLIVRASELEHKLNKQRTDNISVK